MLAEGSHILETFATHGATNWYFQMLPDVCQHIIFVSMLKCTYLAFVIFAAPRVIDLLRKSIHQNHKLGHNDGRQIWNWATSGRNWCRYNPLAFGGDDFGVWWGWRQWYDLAGSYFGWWWFLYLGDSHYGHLGGATIIDEGVAIGDVLKEIIWKIEVCIMAGMWWLSSAHLRF